MLGSVVRAAVGVPQGRLDTLAKIASRIAEDAPGGEVWHEHLDYLIRMGLPSKVEKLLKFLRPISLPAVAKFVVAEKFREGETVDGIKMAWVGKNFKANFLTKVEEAVPALEMREHELVTGSRDPAIITELGGEDRVETFLAHLWEELKSADQNRYHVRYIRDVNRVLWAVNGYWYGGGLRVEADPLDDPSDWRVGYRFASR